MIHCRKCQVSTSCGFWNIKIFNVCRTLWIPLDNILKKTQNLFK